MPDGTVFVSAGDMLGAGAGTPAVVIVVEPVVPDAWAQDIGNPSRLTSKGDRWVKFPTSRSRIDQRCMSVRTAAPSASSRS